MEPDQSDSNSESSENSPSRYQKMCCCCFDVILWDPFIYFCNPIRSVFNCLVEICGDCGEIFDDDD